MKEKIQNNDLNHGHRPFTRTALAMTIGALIGSGITQSWNYAKGEGDPKGEGEKMTEIPTSNQYSPKPIVESKTSSPIGGPEKNVVVDGKKDLRRQCEELKAQDQETAIENVMHVFCLDQKYREKIKSLVEQGYSKFDAESIDAPIHGSASWELNLIDDKGDSATIRLEEEPPCSPERSAKKIEAEKKAREMFAKINQLKEGVEKGAWDEVYDFDISRIRYEMRLAGLDREMGEMVDDLAKLQTQAKSGLATQKEVNLFNCKVIEFSKLKKQKEIQKKISASPYLEENMYLLDHVFAQIMLKLDSFVIPECQKLSNGTEIRISSESELIKIESKPDELPINK